MNKAQLHLVDTLILRFYYKQSHLKWTDIYRIGQRVLERTHCLWVDPTKASDDQLQSLVAELFNNELSIQLLLEDSEKARLLSEIKLPSRTWFYTYFQWFTAQYK